MFGLLSLFFALICCEMCFTHRLEEKFIPPVHLFLPKTIPSNKELDEFRNPFIAMPDIEIWPTPFKDYKFVGVDIHVNLTLDEAKTLLQYQQTAGRIYGKYIGNVPEEISVTSYPKQDLFRDLFANRIKYDRILQIPYHNKGTPESPTMEDINLISYKRLLHVGMTIILTKGHYLYISIEKMIKLMKVQAYSIKLDIQISVDRAKWRFYDMANSLKTDCLKELFIGTEESLRMRHNRSAGYFSKEELNYVHDEFADFSFISPPPMVRCANTLISAFEAYDYVAELYIRFLVDTLAPLNGDYKNFYVEEFLKNDDAAKDRKFGEDIMRYQNLLDSMNGDIFVWYSFLHDLGPASWVSFHSRTKDRRYRLKAIANHIANVHREVGNWIWPLQKLRELGQAISGPIDKKLQNITKNDVGHSPQKIILNFRKSNNEKLLIYDEYLRSPSSMVLYALMPILETSHYYHAWEYMSMLLPQIRVVPACEERLKEVLLIFKLMYDISLVDYNAFLLYSPNMVGIMSTLGYSHDLYKFRMSLIYQPISVAIEKFQNPSQHTLPMDRLVSFQVPKLVPPAQRRINLNEIKNISQWPRKYFLNEPFHYRMEIDELRRKPRYQSGLSDNEHTDYGDVDLIKFDEEEWENRLGVGINKNQTDFIHKFLQLFDAPPRHPYEPSRFALGRSEPFVDDGFDDYPSVTTSRNRWDNNDTYPLNDGNYTFPYYDGNLTSDDDSDKYSTSSVESLVGTELFEKDPDYTNRKQWKQPIDAAAYNPPEIGRSYAMKWESPSEGSSESENDNAQSTQAETTVSDEPLRNHAVRIESPPKDSPKPPPSKEIISDIESIPDNSQQQPPPQQPRTARGAPSRVNIYEHIGAPNPLEYSRTMREATPFDLYDIEAVENMFPHAMRFRPQRSTYVTQQPPNNYLGNYLPPSDIRVPPPPLFRTSVPPMEPPEIKRRVTNIHMNEKEENEVPPANIMIPDVSQPPPGFELPPTVTRLEDLPKKKVVTNKRGNKMMKNKKKEKYVPPPSNDEVHYHIPDISQPPPEFQLPPPVITEEEFPDIHVANEDGTKIKKNKKKAYKL
ncbi:hypothetical protein SNEBB_006463 [Seison nebaliae]|nr:hypothetical protein SNEBB_006463 [Seison nebaliae]